MDRLEILDKPFRRYTDADVEKFFEQIEDIMSVYAEHVPRTCMQDEIPYREHISDEYQSKKEYAQKAINQACAFVNYTERGIADPAHVKLRHTFPFHTLQSALTIVGKPLFVGQIICQMQEYGVFYLKNCTQISQLERSLSELSHITSLQKAIFRTIEHVIENFKEHNQELQKTISLAQRIQKAWEEFILLAKDYGTCVEEHPTFSTKEKMYDEKNQRINGIYAKFGEQMQLVLQNQKICTPLYESLQENLIIWRQLITSLQTAEDTIDDFAIKVQELKCSQTSHMMCIAEKEKMDSTLRQKLPQSPYSPSKFSCISDTQKYLYFYEKFLQQKASFQRFLLLDTESFSEIFFIQKKQQEHTLHLRKVSALVQQPHNTNKQRSYYTGVFIVLSKIKSLFPDYINFLQARHTLFMDYRAAIKELDQFFVSATLYEIIFMDPFSFGRPDAIFARAEKAKRALEDFFQTREEIQGHLQAQLQHIERTAHDFRVREQKRLPP